MHIANTNLEIDIDDAISVIETASISIKEYWLMNLLRAVLFEEDELAAEIVKYIIQTVKENKEC